MRCMFAVPPFVKKTNMYFLFLSCSRVAVLGEVFIILAYIENTESVCFCKTNF